MKKIALLLLLAIIFDSVAFSQNIDKIIDEIIKIDGVEHHSIGGLMLKLGKAVAAKDDKSEFLKHVSKIEVVNSESEAVIGSRFVTALKNFSGGNGYEVIETAEKDDRRVILLAEKKDETVKNLIIVAIDVERLSIVKLSGKMPLSALEPMIKDFKQKKAKH
jgi:hypothetical protein